MRRPSGDAPYETSADVIPAQAGILAGLRNCLFFQAWPNAGEDSRLRGNDGIRWVGRVANPTLAGCADIGSRPNLSWLRMQAGLQPGGILGNNGSAGLKPGLGSVDIQLAKRILRQKMADARQKCEPMPSIGEYFQRGRCRFMAQNPPQPLIVNRPYDVYFLFCPATINPPQYPAGLPKAGRF